METSLVHDVLSVGGIALLGLVGVVYQFTHKRIDRMEDVHQTSVESIGRDVTKIFDKIDNHIGEEDRQFRDIFHAINTNHVEVIKELNKKMDR